MPWSRHQPAEVSTPSGETYPDIHSQHIAADDAEEGEELQELSQARHVIIEKDFLQSAVELRGVFDERFKDPRQTHEARFLWDYWHIPDQYTLIRTQVTAHLSQVPRPHAPCARVQATLTPSYAPACEQFSFSSLRNVHGNLQVVVFLRVCNIHDQFLQRSLPVRCAACRSGWRGRLRPLTSSQQPTPMLIFSSRTHPPTPSPASPLSGCPASTQQCQSAPCRHGLFPTDTVQLHIYIRVEAQNVAHAIHLPAYRLPRAFPSPSFPLSSIFLSPSSCPPPALLPSTTGQLIYLTYLNLLLTNPNLHPSYPNLP